MSQCTNCGASARPGMSRCVKCGSMLPHQAPPPPQQQSAPQQHYAAPAGPAMAGPAPAAPASYVVYQQPGYMPPPKSKVAAALLCFFLGGFGIHNFYLGYAGRGIAQLLLLVLSFCTAGITGLGLFVWLVIDFIMILSGGLRASDGRPLS